MGHYDKEAPADADGHCHAVNEHMIPYSDHEKAGTEQQEALGTVVLVPV